jgi:hypothetical protein
MKHDQHTLELLYSDIIIKENSEFWKIQPEEVYNEPLNLPPDENQDNLKNNEDLDEKNEDSQEQKFDIIIDELKNSKPSLLLLQHLKSLSENEIDFLIKELNEIGNQSEEDEMWYLKDNLIRFLFALPKYKF